MKTFFYTGTNLNNRSGVSWKLWKIETKKRTVTAWWGAAEVVNRRVVPKGALQTKKWTFPSERQARENEAARIEEKLREGYESTPRWR